MKYFTNKKYMGFFAVLAILGGLYAGYSVISNDTVEKTISHVQDVKSPVIETAPAVNTEGTQIIKTTGTDSIKPGVNPEIITNIDKSGTATQ